MIGAVMIGAAVTGAVMIGAAGPITQGAGCPAVYPSVLTLAGRPASHASIAGCRPST